MEQVRQNPTVNESFTVSSYSTTATGSSGLVSGAGIGTATERGQGIILHLDGGSAQGYTEAAEYFVIPVSANTFRIAATVSDALIGNPITSASGDAGAGDVFPIYKIGGVLYVGTGGDVNIRGDGVSKSGLNSFSIHKNVADGSLMPMMVDSIIASGTTAEDFVKWYR